MKIDVGAESPPERLALALGLVPTPVFHTLVPVLAARALLTGTKLGVFETLGQNPLTAADVAAKLGTEREATGKLLNALTGLGYLRAAGNGFVLSSEARRWLVSGSPRSLRDWVLEQELLEWRWLEHLEDFVRTGHTVQAHDALSDDGWGVYSAACAASPAFPQQRWRAGCPSPKGHSECWTSAAHTVTTRSSSVAAIPACGRSFSIFPRRSAMPPRCWPRNRWATA